MIRLIALCVPFMFFNDLTAFAQCDGTIEVSTMNIVYAIAFIISVVFTYCSGYNKGYIEGRIYEASKGKSKKDLTRHLD